jgi:hypothetical protein
VTPADARPPWARWEEDLGLVYPDGTRMPRHDANGRPAYVKVLADRANWVVGQEHVGEYFVSTVWLFAHVPGTPFETALFRKGEDQFGDPYDPEIVRHRSWLAALQFHLTLLSFLQLRCALPPGVLDTSQAQE